MTDKLTRQEERFVAEYLIDLNGVRSYLRAFRKTKSYGAAAVLASDLLKKPNIQDAINSGQARLIAELEISQRRVLIEYRRIAFSDVRKAFTDSGEMKDLRDIDDETAGAIAGIEVEEEWSGKGEARQQTGFTKKVKFWNKLDALGKLEVHLGMDKPQKVELSGGIRWIKDDIG